MRIPLTLTPERPCPYLPGHSSRTRAFWIEGMSGEIYQRFMDSGFRRTACRGCRECLPIRVAVAQFRPNKSQRRCWKRNSDLQISSGPAQASDEKFALYRRYIEQWHGGPANEDRESFEKFLYCSPVQTLEVCYRDASGHLLAVGICDICPDVLSSVYFYFDPSHAERGLGNLGALWEIAAAAERHLPWYYLGYWVKDCPAMRYKSHFHPSETLGHDQVWRQTIDRSER